ncbi:acyl-CoA dehydrogenase family protein [Paramicrobacterium agarici]|uniref:acyl-CoA dehydrogenase family protein n=1 Tax=Paramicrobacterium agarici TaxID=630514 RepID=UPI001151D967|nr:acyl-CoA dehydrogenase family protein [Microbacterium agarici]TQO23893.1 alkylation response protein AidB-like acyl-CoA dehydrogenase [Microbacterium agarici]
MTDLLPDALLERIRSRAAELDRSNGFFHDDLEDLMEAGYLKAFVPTELGGSGLSLVEVSRLQRRLATAAPATALAVNMHLIWTGVAQQLRRRGDSSLDFVLEGASRGEVYAFGISEAGNDLVLVGSNSEARPDGEGGYSFYGTKIFTSLSPAWTVLGTMGLDSTSDDAPKIAYGFVRRADGGFTIKDDWDTVGMRATQSRTTILEGAHASHDRVVRRLDPGPNPDPFIFAISSNFQLLVASVYTGLAERALELAIETAKKRTSKQNNGAAYSDDAVVRWRIADAWMALDAIPAQIERAAQDIADGVDHASLWFPKLSAIKVRATETARSVVDQAIAVAGGSSYFSKSELGRLYRDVLAGAFHPSDSDAAHKAAANGLLGPVSGA